MSETVPMKREMIHASIFVLSETSFNVSFVDISVAYLLWLLPSLLDSVPIEIKDRRPDFSDRRRIKSFMCYQQLKQRICISL